MPGSSVVQVAPRRALGKGKAPKHVLVFPVGYTSTEPPNPSYWVTELSWKMLKAQLDRYGPGFYWPGDYDHQGYYEGRPAPRPFRVLKWWWVPEEGIWAEWEWTEQGQEAVESGEWGFFSPVINHTMIDGKRTLVGMCASIGLTKDQPAPIALTNLPATHGQEELALKLSMFAQEFGDKTQEGEKSMDELKRIAELLKLDPATATWEDVMRELAALIETGQKVTPPVDEEALKKAAVADVEKEVALKFTSALGFKVASVDEAAAQVRLRVAGTEEKGRLAALEQQLAQMQGKELYQTHALKLSKFEQEQKDENGNPYWQQLAIKQPEVFTAVLSHRPAAVPGPLPGKKDQAGVAAPSAAALHIAAKMGVTAEELAKYNKTLEG